MQNFTIYVFKTHKKLEGTDIIQEQSIADDKAEREAVRTELIKFTKRLDGVDVDAYNAVYKKGLDKIANMYNYPEQKLKSIGYRKNKDGVTITSMPAEDVKAKIAEIVSNTYSKVEAEFDNMDFAYQLWRPKFLEGQGVIWLSKEEIQEAIKLADSAVSDKYHPEQYLPQEDGEYGPDYIKNVRQFRMSCKHLLKLIEKRCQIYAIIYQRRSK